MVLLNEHFIFPPVQFADENGLLAIGGGLEPERIRIAYVQGIFPWYNEADPICWWSPDPRCVLFPGQLKVSKSMQQVMRNGAFRFTMNRCFEEVARNCQTIPRRHEEGTWINEEIINAYTAMHTQGLALSAETWKDGLLVGGLYGVRIGRVFFGESMFSRESNASKFAFISLVQALKKEGIQLIDCQMRTNHLVSLGATMLPREQYIELLKLYCK